MIFCKELNKEFKDKQELFEALKANKEQILNVKKSTIQKSFEKGSGIKGKFLDVSKLSTQCKGIDIEKDFHYIAVNTTNVLDSHDDLHVRGIWEKTVQEQQKRNYLVFDHELKATQTIVRKEHIEMFTADVPFSMIGKSYPGETQALIYKFPKDKVINQMAKDWLESGDDIEASVRMQYVKIELGMNSDQKEDVEEKAVYDQFINQIANKEELENINYFFVVKEAKNISESSLVLKGSNSSTGRIKNIEPFENTQKNEPSEDTHEFSVLDAIHNYKPKF